MVYASITYDFMSPYLKGIHLSIEFWRPTRHSSSQSIEKEKYEDGPHYMLFQLLEDKGIDLILPPPPEASQKVELVPRVLKETKALD